MSGSLYFLARSFIIKQEDSAVMFPVGKPQRGSICPNYKSLHEGPLPLCPPPQSNESYLNSLSSCFIEWSRTGCPTHCWPCVFLISQRSKTLSLARIAADMSEPFRVGLKATKPICVLLFGAVGSIRLWVRSQIPCESFCRLCQGDSRDSKWFLKAPW